MGYTTEFTGEVRIDPPLNRAEREYLLRFGASRRMSRPGGRYATGSDGEDKQVDVDAGNTPPHGQPGLWCQWVPTEDGSALVWDGREKFYKSSRWMKYLIDTFLRPGAKLKSELRYPFGGDDHPDEFAHFTFDHVLNGDIVARGQDGASWRIEVVDNEVAVVELCGPAPTEYVVFVVDRHDQYDLDREFDAAFDLGPNQFSRVRAEDPEFARVVRECVTAVHPDAVDGEAEGHPGLVDERIGLRVTVIRDCVRIGLLAAEALPDAERTFGLVQDLVAAITERTGWIAYDPAQRIAVRPGKEFRRRAISLIRGWTEEPDGRYMWGVP